MLIQRFNDLVSRLQLTTSRIEKESILNEYKEDQDIKEILYFIYNPYIVTGISTKKINKEFFSIPHKHNPCNLLFMLDYLKVNNHGRDEDLEFINEYLMFNMEYKDLLKQIFSKSLKLGIQTTTLNKVFGKGFIPTFGCMLSNKYFDNPEKLLPQGTEFILTTKLDGVRCVMIKKDGDVKFFSRQGQVFEGLTELEREAKLIPIDCVIDGELLLNLDLKESKDLYRETMKVVSSDKEKLNVNFNCFDMLTPSEFERGFSDSACIERKANLMSMLTNIEGLDHFKYVDILYLGIDQSKIQYWLDKITNEGGEGVMINIAGAPYESKRSNFLLKVKKFNTADVLVYGIEEGTGQNKGRLGALKTKFLGPDGKEYKCDVGSGLSQEQRIDFWNNPNKVLNKIIEIGYFEISQNQQGTYGLRFPTFKWVREDKTEISMY